MKNYRKYGGSTSNATLYATGSDIYRLIYKSNSIRFSQKSFFENASWFELADSNGLINPKNNLKRAKRLSKMYDIPFVWKDKYVPTYGFGNGWGRYYSEYATSRPEIVYYEKEDRFISSVPLIEVGKSDYSGNATKESEAIRESCKLGCIACNMLDSYPKSKDRVLVNMKHKYKSVDFSSSFESLCTTHASQLMNSIGKRDYCERTKEINLMWDDDILKFISFLASKTKIKEGRKK